MAGSGVLAVAAIAAVIATPRLFGGPADPGCQAYASTALPAYDRAIGDLNARAPARKLDADVTSAISALSAAAGRSRAPAATTALDSLLAQLKAVRADVARGTVPGSAVRRLNAASTTADHAC